MVDGCAVAGPVGVVVGGVAIVGVVDVAGTAVAVAVAVHVAVAVAVATRGLEAVGAVRGLP